MSTLSPIQYFNKIVKENREYRDGEYQQYLEKEKASKAATNEAQKSTIKMINN